MCQSVREQGITIKQDTARFNFQTVSCFVKSRLFPAVLASKDRFLPQKLQEPLLTRAIRMVSLLYGVIIIVVFPVQSSGSKMRFLVGCTDDRWYICVFCWGVPAGANKGFG